MFSSQCGLGNSTDAVLGEVKKSFLTTNPVTPVGKGPLVVSSEQRYSRVAVMRARAANDEQHTLLFLITGETVNRRARAVGAWTCDQNDQILLVVKSFERVFVVLA